VLVKAGFRVVGSRGSIEGVALVDTGASLTMLDRGAADSVGVRYVGRRVRAVVADGREVEGELAVVDRLAVEGEELPYAYVAVLDFPAKVREKLREEGLSDCCIIGLTTLELLQLTPDAATGRLRKTSALLL